MKYSAKIVIDLPLDEVVSILDNDQNLIHWQHGLQNFEHLSGDLNTIGAKMKLNYILNSQKMSLIKTTTKRNLPDELHFQFDMKGLHFLQENYFRTTVDGFTEWHTKNKFVPTSFFTQVMVILAPGDFKKQISKYLKDFKTFAEKGISISAMEVTNI